MMQWQNIPKVLADPVRRKVLLYLRLGERTLHELTMMTGLNSIVITEHLRVLTRVDLVRVEQRRTTQVYLLNTTVCQDILVEAMKCSGQT